MPIDLFLALFLAVSAALTLHSAIVAAILYVRYLFRKRREKMRMDLYEKADKYISEGNYEALEAVTQRYKEAFGHKMILFAVEPWHSEDER